MNQSESTDPEYQETHRRQINRLFMAKFSKQDMQEIMKLFDHELSLLIRMDRFPKMDLRKRINNIVLPILEMDIPHPRIFMDIVEDRLQDVLDRFIDGYESKKKLERKVTEKLKYKRF